MWSAKRLTYVDRATAKVANVQDRLHAVGMLERDVTLELRTDGEVYWLAYVRGDDFLRTSATIGESPRDVFRWADGFAHAAFSLTESAYMALTPVRSGV